MKANLSLDDAGKPRHPVAFAVRVAGVAFHANGEIPQRGWHLAPLARLRARGACIARRATVRPCGRGLMCRPFHQNAADELGRIYWTATGDAPVMLGSLGTGAIPAALRLVFFAANHARHPAL